MSKSNEGNKDVRNLMIMVTGRTRRDIVIMYKKRTKVLRSVGSETGIQSFGFKKTRPEQDH